MDWIFDHFRLLIGLAAVIAWILKNRSRTENGQGDQTPPAKEYEFDDPELAERTRTIREEIQRKIAERRGQHTQPPVLSAPVQSKPSRIERSLEATPPPVIVPETLREALQPKPAPVTQPERRMMTVNVAGEAERQAALMQKLREAELMKAAAQRRAAFVESTADKEPAALQQARAGLSEDLRDPQALRRAFVLREIIGPPVGMR